MQHWNSEFQQNLSKALCSNFCFKNCKFTISVQPTSFFKYYTVVVDWGLI